MYKGEENMLGTIVNAIVIIAGGLLGLLLKGGIPKRVQETVMNGLSLCIIYIGLSGTMKGQNVLLIIISMVIGCIIGELLNLEMKIKNLGDFIESKSKGKLGKLSDGFVTSSLLFCVGAMAIVGSLESGLTGNHTILYAKSMIDGITSIIFASSMGVGVLLSSVSVFIYQGIITLGASFLKGILVQAVINDMTAVGSLLIIGLGFNMLKMTKIKVANLLPAVFIPIFYAIIKLIF